MLEITLILLIIVCIAGCTTGRIKPLGSPEHREIKAESIITTLEYRVPVIQVFKCPVHGEIAGSDVRKIKGEHYCEACLFEKLLAK